MRVTAGASFLGLLLALSAAAQKPGDSTPSKPQSPSKIGGKSLDEWIKDLQSTDASRRAQAIVSIVEFGEASSAAVPAVVARLADPDVSPRCRAMWALRNMAVDGKDIDRVVKGVSARLVLPTETQAIVRYEAAITLYRFVPEGEPAVPNLITATMDRASWEIRHNAVSLLWRISVGRGTPDSPPDNRIVEALLTSLRNDKTYQVRLETIQGLGAIGRPGTPMLLQRVISDLNLCAGHSNKPLAIWAYVGLVAMQDGKPAEQSLNTLAKFAQSKDLETRVQASIALGALSGKAKSKVPTLLENLKDKEPLAVQAACRALGSIGDTREAVINALVETLTHEDPATAASAVVGLVNLKQRNSRVMGLLDKMLEKKDLDRRVRYVIEEGLKELKAPPKK